MTKLLQVTDDLVDHISLMWCRVLELSAQVVVETGTARGDSARIWAKILEETGGRLWSIDLLAPNAQEILAWAPTFSTQYPQHTLCLEQDSRTYPWDGRPIDILFLDSDHHYEHVLAELQHWGPWMRPGGTILLHDSAHRDGDDLGTRRSLGSHVLDAIQDFTRPHKLPWHHYPGKWGMAEIPMPPTWRTSA